MPALLHQYRLECRLPVGYTSAWAGGAAEMAVSATDPFRIFVTHTFEDNEDYQRVFEYLESRDNFFYMAFSNPANIPGAGGPEAIKEELRNQINPAEVVIMPVALYDKNRDLIGFQMDVAQAFNKPIVAIQSFGETVTIEKKIIDRCNEMIDWNDRTIIEAIRRQARNEDTTQWETIEFTLD